MKLHTRTIRVVVAALTVAAWPMATGAQGVDHCGPDETPVFEAGFADLKDFVGELMGDPTTCVYVDTTNSGRDLIQLTTTGIALWLDHSQVFMYSGAGLTIEVFPNDLGPGLPRQPVRAAAAPPEPATIPVDQQVRLTSANPDGRNTAQGPETAFELGGANYVVTWTVAGAQVIEFKDIATARFVPLVQPDFGGLQRSTPGSTDTVTGEPHTGTTYVYGLTPGPQTLRALAGPWTVTFTPLAMQLAEAVASNGRTAVLVVGPATGAAGNSPPFTLFAGRLGAAFLTMDPAPFQPVLTRVDGQRLDASAPLFPVPTTWLCGASPCAPGIARTGNVVLSLQQGGQYVMQVPSPRSWLFWFQPLT